MSGLEIFGAAASIPAILKVSKTIISMCRVCINSFDGDSSEFRVILIEISTLRGMTESLLYLTMLETDRSPLMSQLAAIVSPIEACEKALKELVALLPVEVISKSGKKSKFGKLDVTLAAMKWPPKSAKAKVLLQEIIQYKTTISLAFTAEIL
jgi:hypothetical protein